MAAKHRPSFDRFEHYVVPVTSWDLSWSFSISDLKRDPDPYREYSTLTFRGEVYRPSPFRYPRAEVTLSGRSALLEPAEDSARRGIGSLDARDDLLTAYLFIPIDRVAILIAAASRVRAVILGGDRLFRRRGLIRSVDVSTEFKPEDW